MKMSAESLLVILFVALSRAGYRVRSYAASRRRWHRYPVGQLGQPALL